MPKIQMRFPCVLSHILLTCYNKVRKDYKQAALIAKKIALDKTLYQELIQIIRALPDNLRQKMRQGAKTTGRFIKAPDLLEEDITIIEKIAQDV